jgi:hypothetical protein
MGGQSIAGGLIVVTIGMIFLLDNFGVLEANAFRRWWPLLLVILGVTKLATRGWRPLSDKPNVDTGSTQG